ncbi:MAG: 4a-hydroxytetrahydrobiopterin dehydratase [Bacteroidales bacterium]|jgi:4a-hydroxytetrahydrobiopterin dehydratase|nr:4a-hydroxytetrahydrobiopterin dehydratase [Bacteroidales bacterium]
MELEKKKCIPCEGGIPPLTEDEVLEYISVVKGWIIQDNKKIIKKLDFVNFKHTMSFVNEVARISDEEGHHPVMHISYGSAEIELWTHAIDGLSENDFILAAKIDRI